MIKSFHLFSYPSLNLLVETFLKRCRSTSSVLVTNDVVSVNYSTATYVKTEQLIELSGTDTITTESELTPLSTEYL